MRHFLLLSLSSSIFLLAGCSQPYNIASNYNFKPNNKNKGIMIMSIVCNDFDANTKNYLFYHDAHTSQVGRIFSAGTDSYVKFHCDGPKPQYSIQVLPAGHYEFTSLSFNRRVNSLFHLEFDVVKNKITYIGRLYISALHPIRPETILADMLPPNTIRYKLTNNGLMDIPHFKLHYPNLVPQSYRIDIGKLH